MLCALTFRGLDFQFLAGPDRTQGHTGITRRPKPVTSNTGIEYVYGFYFIIVWPVPVRRRRAAFELDANRRGVTFLLRLLFIETLSPAPGFSLVAALRLPNFCPKLAPPDYAHFAHWASRF